MIQNQVQVKVKPLNHSTIIVKLKGKTPLLMDKMPESTKAAILEKQTGASKSGSKSPRDIKKEVTDAIHKTSDGTIGFPAAGFKYGMIEAASFVGDKFFSKKLVSGSTRILNSVEGLIPIQYKKLDTLQHNIGHNTKFTPQFHDWSCELLIQYDANNIAPSDIVSLLDYAGFYSGIGAWRPKCKDGGSGDFGTYEVVKETKKVKA